MGVAADVAVPRRVHLLTAKGMVLTQDGRDFEWDGKVPKLCSFDGASVETSVPVDINHANSKRGPQGFETPAYGWLRSLSVEADGIWGEVEWTPKGEASIRAREYRGLSPELLVRGKTIIGIRGLSLTNHPAVKGLAKLFSIQSQKKEDDMDEFLADLAKLLGVSETEPPKLLSVVAGLKVDADAKVKMLSALGAQQGDDPMALIAGLKTDGSDVKSLTAQVVELSTSLTALQTEVKRKAAETVIDKAIHEGRAGIKALKDHFIARHMLSVESAQAVELEISKLPKLAGALQLSAELPTEPDGGLTAEDLAVAKLMGVSVEALKKSELEEMENS